MRRFQSDVTNLTPTLRGAPQTQREAPNKLVLSDHTAPKMGVPRCQIPKWIWPGWQRYLRYTSSAKGEAYSSPSLQRSSGQWSHGAGATSNSWVLALICSSHPRTLMSIISPSGPLYLRLAALLPGHSVPLARSKADTDWSRSST